MRTMDIIAAILVAAASRSVLGANPAPAAKATTPRELAEKLLDDCRDDQNRKKIRVIWPKDPPPDVPEAADVYLIDGVDYFGRQRTCKRLVWAKGGLKAHRLRLTRPFSGSTNEPSYADAPQVDPGAFERAWRAADLLRRARPEYRAPAGPFMTMRGGVP